MTCRHWAEGSAGIVDLAERVAAAAGAGAGPLRLLYGDALGLTDKIRTVARDIYGAADVALSGKAAKACRRIEDAQRQGSLFAGGVAA